MKVLMAVDGSDESLQGVQEVGNLLSGDRDRVLLYTRVPDLGPGDAKSKGLVDHYRDLLAKGILEEAMRRLSPAIPVETLVGTNDPRRGIVLAAEQIGADLIVVGARGLSVFRKLRLGSVSSAVVHSSRIPVWVSRTRSHQGGAMQVLVACHDPDAALSPARLLSHLSWPDKSRFRLLTTTSFFGGPVPERLQQKTRSPEIADQMERWAQQYEQEAESLRNRLHEVVSVLNAPLKDARPTVVEGNAADIILTTIATDQVDLVVIGSHTRRPAISTLLGGTAEAVLNHAPCSVLVVPHQEQP